jgi:hypothetical protein
MNLKTVWVAVFVIIAAIGWKIWSHPTSPISVDKLNWRSKVDHERILTDEQRATVLASLKPILQQSARRQGSVSTLLILAKSEQTAARIGGCLLQIVNSVQHLNEVL